MKKNKLIAEISKLHPSFGVKKGWSSYTGGMTDSGQWDFPKLLEAPDEELEAFLNSCKAKNEKNDWDSQPTDEEFLAEFKNSFREFFYGKRRQQAMKMIELSNDRYVVVDDSEIKEFDYAIHKSKEFRQEFNEQPILCTKMNCDYIQETHAKITHSTKPLEKVTLDAGVVTSFRKCKFINIKQLPLSEVEEAIRGKEEAIDGFNVEEMAENKYPIEKGGSMWIPTLHDYIQANRREGFIEGFIEAMKLMKDKLPAVGQAFSIEDMREIFERGIVFCEETVPSLCSEESLSSLSKEEKDDKFDAIIQSLIPKKEWDVEFDENGKLKLLNQ